MKIICQKCKGNGFHKKPYSGEQFWLAPFTLGLSLIRDIIGCKICNKKGYIENN